MFNKKRLSKVLNFYSVEISNFPVSGNSAKPQYGLIATTAFSSLPMTATVRVFCDDQYWHLPLQQSKSLQSLFSQFFFPIYPCPFTSLCRNYVHLPSRVQLLKNTACLSVVVVMLQNIPRKYQQYIPFLGKVSPTVTPKTGTRCPLQRGTM